MKYKVGDIVVIKTWEELKEEFTYDKEKQWILLSCMVYDKEMEDIIVENNRIFTISRILRSHHSEIIYEVIETKKWILVDIVSHKLSDIRIFPKSNLQSRIRLLDLQSEK